MTRATTLAVISKWLIGIPSAVFLSTTPAQAGLSCKAVFGEFGQRLTAAQTRLLVEEFAGRFISIADDAEPSARAIAFADLRFKIVEAENATGIDFRSLIAFRIQELRRGEEAPETRQERRDAETRRAVESFRMGTTLFEEVPRKIGLYSMHSAAVETTPDGNVRLTTGVQWGGDERFLLVRDEVNRTRVFDSLKRIWIEDLNLGFLSQSGPFYIEPDKTGFTIRDLESGATWGPFRGRVLADRFHPNFAVSIEEFAPEKRTSSLLSGERVVKNVLYRVVDFRNGKEYEFKHALAYSADRSVIAGFVDEETINVIDLQTGETKHSMKASPFQGNGSERRLPLQIQEGALIARVPSEGAGWFQKLMGQDIPIALRLRDLKKLELPDRSGEATVIDDGAAVVVKSHTPKTGSVIDILEFDSDRKTPVSGFVRADVSSNPRWIVLSNPGARSTTIFDRNSHGSFKLEASFALSKDRTHLVNESWGGRPFTWDFVGARSIRSMQLGAVTPIAGTNFALVDLYGNSKESTRIGRVEMRRIAQDGYLVDLVMAADDALPSPSGRHLLVNERGLVRLQTVELKDVPKSRPNN